ncbi:hypothetical protein [Mesorhizobium amorphae]|nr:hypothetical protein [Mesorhizobium amorphae]
MTILRSRVWPNTRISVMGDEQAAPVLVRGHRAKALNAEIDETRFGVFRM